MKRIASSVFRTEYPNLTEPHEVMRYGEVVGYYYPGDTYLRSMSTTHAAPVRAQVEVEVETTVLQGPEQSVEEEAPPAPAPAFVVPPRSPEPRGLDSFSQYRPVMKRRK